MTTKAMLVAAASVLSVSPAFALTNSQIVHHSGGPIPYSELSSSTGSGAGYDAHGRRHKRAAAQAGASEEAGAATSPTTSGSSAAAPSAGYNANPGSAGATAPSTGYNANPSAPGPAASSGLDNNGVNGAAGANPAPAPGSEGSAAQPPTGGANTPTTPGTTSGSTTGSAGASAGASGGGAAPQ